MILEDVKPLDVQTIGEMEDGLIADISEESKAFVFELVSKQLYSNPIGSVIREIASNCLDSHTEAGVVEPIVIRKTHNSEEGYSIEFQDFGVGMSPERVTKIYMNYFTSTKRDSNDQIGGFGIGSKTPLAYADMFYITTIFGGKRYEYLFHKGANKPTLESMLGYETVYDEVPLPPPTDQDDNELPTLFEQTTKVARRVPIGEPTDEHNGTTIRVVMEKDDIYTFESELRTQLTYFDSVYFERWSISNHYDIYEGKYFKYRSDIPQSSYGSNIHLCIGNVRYAIDFNKISLPLSYSGLPIGVKFDIGELKVTPSRETIRYEENTAKMITDRIKLAVNELIEMFDKQNPEVEDLSSFIKVSKDKPRVTFDEEKMHYLYLTGLEGISKSFKYAPIAKLNITQTPANIFFMWEVVARIINGRRITVDSHTMSRRNRGSYTPENTGIVTNELIAEKRFLIMGKDDKPSMYTDLYIGDNYSSDVFIIKRKTMEYKAASRLLGMKDSAKGVNKAKTLIEYLKIVNGIVAKKGKKYSDMRPSPEWIRDYQKSVKETSMAFLRKKRQEVFIRDMSYGRSETVKLESLTSRTGILVYGFKEDKKILEQLYNTVVCHSATIRKAKERSKAFKVIQVSNEVAKKLIGADNKKIVDWQTFVKTKFFRKLCTAYRLHTADKHSLTQQRWRDELLEGFKEGRQAVNAMINKYHNASHSFALWAKINENEMPEMVKMVKSFVAKYDFELPPLLRYIDTSVTIHADEFKDVLDYIKSKKVPLLKREFYLKKPAPIEQITEEAPPEEEPELTEQQVCEILDLPYDSEHSAPAVEAVEAVEEVDPIEQIIEEDGEVSDEEHNASNEDYF